MISLVFVATALAGCAGDDAPPTQQCEVGDPGCDDPCLADPESCVVSEGKGVARGVVVDEKLHKLEGVKVELLVADSDSIVQTTDEEGFWIFSDLEPGNYVVIFSKVGYFSQQIQPIVEADVAAPAIIRTALVVDEATRPYFDTYVFSGFLDCAVGLPLGAAVNPCSPPAGTSINVFQANLSSSRVPTFIQSEMKWQSNSGSVGSSMMLSHFVPDGSADGAFDYNLSRGVSPLIVKSDNATLEEHEVGSVEDLRLRVFPSDSSADPAAATFSQSFDIISHVFYGYAPPEDWTFGNDGEPERQE